MEFTFRIYPTSKDGHARELIATQTAMDLDDYVKLFTKLFKILKRK